jgi:hypothetical protein
MTTKKLTRGIDKKFADAFKNCEVYKLYEEHKDELIIAVRNGYLNVYYNCESIAKVECKQGLITCKIDKYFLDGKPHIGKDKYATLSPCEICNEYDTIKRNSSAKAKAEKKAQSRLVILNNQNDDSNWFCIDVEWAKAFVNQLQKDREAFNGRFDIIALSRKTPHTVAVIELKYGSDAIGGKSGIYKHIGDFNKFQEKDYFGNHLKQELIDIVESQKLLGINVPSELQELKSGIILQPEFYVVTLNNNGEPQSQNTPKQTMSGYLFNDKRWNCKRKSPKTVESKFGDVTKKNNKIHVAFLFSKQILDNLTITDIIDGNYDEKILPA